MSDFFGKLKSGAEKLTFEAEKMAKLSRVKGDLENLKIQIQAHYAKLGELYFAQRATTGVTGSAFDEICLAIDSLNQQVKAKNEEIERINTETFAPQGAQSTPPPVAAQAQYSSTPPVPVPPSAATKFCPNCGKENQAGVKFCPDCGTSL